MGLRGVEIDIATHNGVKGGRITDHRGGGTGAWDGDLGPCSDKGPANITPQQQNLPAGSRTGKGPDDNEAWKTCIRQSHLRSGARAPTSVLGQGGYRHGDIRSDGAVHRRTCGPQAQPSAALERARRRLLRCAEGSRRWRERRAVLDNQRHRERVRNRNECHRLTTAIVRRFGLIAVEDLTMQNTSGSVRSKLESPGGNAESDGGPHHPIQEQTWGLMQSQLAHKAEWAGREFVRVPPSDKSLTCSACGVIDESAYAGTRFECHHCGNRMDADMNAAINVLRRGLAGGTSPPTASESSEMCAS